MKWIYAIRQKLKVAMWSVVIIIIFFSISWIDKRNVNTLNTSFSSVFEDRLLVESYIFQLTDHLYQKKILYTARTDYFLPDDLRTKITYHNNKISTLVADYEKTLLTEAEAVYFTHLKTNLFEIQNLENKLILSSANNENSATLMEKMQNGFDIALLDLNRLSRIQIEEGRLLNDQSKKITAGANMLTKFELVMIIGVGLLVQILIFASKSVVPKKPQQFNLN